MDFAALGSVIIGAAIIEAVWETTKMIWQNGKLNVDKLGALIVGVVVALGAGLDLCALAGLKFQWPFIGQILTGLLISRGSNFVHDFLAAINNLNQNTK